MSLVKSLRRMFHRPAKPRNRSHHRKARHFLEILEDRTLLSVYTVDRLSDTGAGSGLTGDLRYCITHATSGQDTIQFSVNGTINLTGLTGNGCAQAVETPAAMIISAVIARWIMGAPVGVRAA